MLVKLVIAVALIAVAVIIGVVYFVSENKEELEHLNYTRKRNRLRNSYFDSLRN